MKVVKKKLKGNVPKKQLVQFKAVTKINIEVYNKSGELIYSHDEKTETYDTKNNNSESDKSIERACLDSNCTLENLQALIEEESDMRSEIEECEELLIDHDNGTEIMNSEDHITYATIKEENITQLINLRSEIDMMENELQDVK